MCSMQNQINCKLILAGYLCMNNSQSYFDSFVFCSMYLTSTFGVEFTFLPFATQSIIIIFCEHCTIELNANELFGHPEIVPYISKAKRSLSLWSKLAIGHCKWSLNTNLFLINQFLITKFDCINTKYLGGVWQYTLFINADNFLTFSFLKLCLIFVDSAICQCLFTKCNNFFEVCSVLA